MTTHTPGNLVSAGHNIITTDDDEPMFASYGPNAAANEARLLLTWGWHDELAKALQIIADGSVQPSAIAEDVLMRMRDSL